MGRNLAAFLFVQSGVFLFFWPNLFRGKRLPLTRFEGYLFGSLTVIWGFVYLFRLGDLKRDDMPPTGRRLTVVLSLVSAVGLCFVYRYTAFDSPLLGTTAHQPAPRGLLIPELAKAGLVLLAALPIGLLTLRGLKTFRAEPDKEERFEELLHGAQPTAAEQASMARTNRVFAIVLGVVVVVVYAIVVRQFLIH